MFNDVYARIRNFYNMLLAVSAWIEKFGTINLLSLKKHLFFFFKTLHAVIIKSLVKSFSTFLYMSVEVLDRSGKFNNKIPINIAKYSTSFILTFKERL